MAYTYNKLDLVGYFKKKTKRGQEVGRQCQGEDVYLGGVSWKSGDDYDQNTIEKVQVVDDLGLHQRSAGRDGMRRQKESGSLWGRCKLKAMNEHIT